MKLEDKPIFHVKYEEISMEDYEKRVAEIKEWIEKNPLGVIVCEPSALSMATMMDLKDFKPA